MNLHYYWSRPLSRLLCANIVFFTDYYRPMGGLFYWITYTLAGFDAFPFRVLVFVILSINLWLMFLTVRRLTRSTELAMLAVFLGAYHAYLASIYYDTGMVYDVLAFFFYYCALAWHLKIRQGGALPTGWQVLGLLAIYVCAINSKEIAVSLPIVVMSYELLWNPPLSLRPRALSRWLLREGRVGLLMGICTLFYIAGKAIGAESLFRHPLYRPHVSLSMCLQTYATYLSGFTYNAIHFTPWKVASLLMLMGASAVVARNRILGFAAVFAIVGILPIAFIPPRNGFAMYVPYVAWVLYAATAVMLVAERMERVAPRWVARAIVILAVTGAVVPAHMEAFQYVRSAILLDRHGIRQTHDQIHAMFPRLKPGASMLFLNDTFPPETEWDLYFLIRLSYNDPTLKIERVKRAQLGREVRLSDDFDLVIDYVDGQYTDVTRTWKTSRGDSQKSPPS